MKNKLIGISLVCLFGAGIYVAYNFEELFPNPEQCKRDVQLLITPSTSLMKRGSKVGFVCSVKNNSKTITYYYDETDPTYDFQISLTNDSGNVFRLSPDPAIQPVFYLGFSLELAPERTYEKVVTLPVDESIPPGTYKLYCKRDIYLKKAKKDGFVTFTSNIIEVQIK